MKITIRRQSLRDAKRFFEILNNPNFKYFDVKINSVKEERAFLKKNAYKRKNNIEHNFTILTDKKVVGAVGVKIRQHRTYIGEIGYFLDEDYWGKGITTKAVKLVEKIGFKEFGLKRIEIIMDPRNKGSEKVAIKAGYKKEGLLKRFGKDKNGKLFDRFLYAKVK